MPSSLVKRRRLAMVLGCLCLAAGSGAQQAAPKPDPILAVRFLRDGAQVIAVSRTDVEVWDIASRSVVRHRPISTTVSSVERVLSPDGRVLAMHVVRSGQSPDPLGPASGRYETQLLNIDTGKITALRPAVSGTPSGLAFSPDGRSLVRFTVQNDRIAYDVWRVPAGDRIEDGRIAKHTVGPVHAALSPTGDALAMSTVPDATPVGSQTSGRIDIHETRSGALQATLPIGARALAFSPDGEILFASTGTDPRVHAFDRNSWKPLEGLGMVAPAPLATSSSEPNGARAPTTMLALSSSPARVLAASTIDRSLRIWDTPTRALVRSIQLESEPWSADMSADGRLIAAGTAGGLVVIAVASSEQAAPVLTTAPPRQPGTQIAAGRFGAGAYYPGGNISHPTPVRRSQPKYTREAMELKIVGEVHLEIVVRPDGTVDDLRVTQSLDSRYGLDNEAVNAARQWVFNPARDRSGRAVAVLVTLVLEFRLH